MLDVCMRSLLVGRSFALPVVLGLAVALGALACERVKMPYEMPGPPGCGMRDPSQTGPSMLSVAQQNTLRGQGTPGSLEDNERGGKTWIYFRQAGSVFGEKETVETFTFDKDGILVAQKTDLRKYVGK